jgi:hypothetical protein
MKLANTNAEMTTEIIMEELKYIYLKYLISSDFHAATNFSWNIWEYEETSINGVKRNIKHSSLGICALINVN